MNGATNGASSLKRERLHLAQLYESSFDRAENAKRNIKAGDTELARSQLLLSIEGFMKTLSLETKQATKNLTKDTVKELLALAESLPAPASSSSPSSSADRPRQGLQSAATPKGKQPASPSVSLSSADYWLEQAEYALSQERYKQAYILMKQTAEVWIKKLQVESSAELSAKTASLLSRIEALSPKAEFETQNQVRRKGSGLTSEERSVLAATSVIANNTFLPWDDAQDCIVSYSPFDSVFVDTAEMKLSSKQISHKARWVRLTELSRNPAIIRNDHGGVSAYTLKQTLISDCSFVSALSVAANYEARFRRRLITAAMYPQNSDGKPILNPNGKYVVRMFLNGVWRRIVIDDRVPVDPFNRLLCSHTQHEGEFWVSLLEKAFLKAMGGYEFPGSNGHIDLMALTGWIPESIPLKGIEAQMKGNDTSAADRIWQRINGGHSFGDCLLTVATLPLDEAEATRAGLVPAHAYAVIRVQQTHSKRMIQLKNPWSNFRFKGKFSASDAHNWTPQLRKALSYDQLSALEQDNGVFWIDLETLVHYFSAIYVNWNPSLFRFRISMHEHWPSSLGPQVDTFTCGDNPQYVVRVEPAPSSSSSSSNEALLWILLSRHCTTSKALNPDEFMTIHVLENGGKRAFAYVGEKRIHKGIYHSTPHYLIRLEVDGSCSTMYTLVVSQYKKVRDVRFTLSVFCTHPCQVGSIPNDWRLIASLSSEWSLAASTANGNCALHPDPTVYARNPQFHLQVCQSGSNILLKLEAPKDVAVHIAIFRILTTAALRSGPLASLMNATVCEPFVPLSDMAYRSGFAFMVLEKMPKAHYIVVPSTYKAGTQAKFILKLLYDSKSTAATNKLLATLKPLTRGATQ